MGLNLAQPSRKNATFQEESTSLVTLVKWQWQWTNLTGNDSNFRNDYELIVVDGLMINRYWYWWGHRWGDANQWQRHRRRQQWEDLWHNKCVNKGVYQTSEYLYILVHVSSASEFLVVQRRCLCVFIMRGLVPLLSYHVQRMILKTS